MRAIILILIISIHSSFAQEQPLKKLKEVKIQSGIKRISVDRLGGFYTASECGIEQFNPEGKLTSKYFPATCNSTELLEAWPLMRIYAYNHSKQQFTIFDSNLEEVSKLDIDPAFAVEPILAAPSTDLKSYWILDMDNSIKQVNINSNFVALESEALKDIKGQFVYMREYQSMLFILNADSGIYIINKLGQLISKVEVSGINYFSFAGEDLYYLKGNEIHFYDIFSKDEYSTKVPNGVNFALTTDERLILFKKDIAELFAWHPKK